MATKPTRASKPLSEKVAVPDGTPGEPINPAVKFWLKKYRKFGKAGATGFIDQCSTIAFAEEELSSTNFERFCLELKLDITDGVSLRLAYWAFLESPLFRKLKKIGLEADRLKRAGEQIPHSLTMLYHLAKMKKADFDRILATGKLHSAMTVRELRNAISAPRRKVKKLADDYGAKVKQSKPLSALAKTATR
jgi:hypothetical protein